MIKYYGCPHCGFIGVCHVYYIYVLGILQWLYTSTYVKLAQFTNNVRLSRSIFVCFISNLRSVTKIVFSKHSSAICVCKGKHSCATTIFNEYSCCWHMIFIISTLLLFSVMWASRTQWGVQYSEASWAAKWKYY